MFQSSRDPIQLLRVCSFPHTDLVDGLYGWTIFGNELDTSFFLVAQNGSWEQQQFKIHGYSICCLYMQHLYSVWLEKLTGMECIDWILLYLQHFFLFSDSRFPKKYFMIGSIDDKITVVQKWTVFPPFWNV